MPDFRRPEYPKLAIIVFLSLFVGLVFGGLIVLNPNYELGGISLIFSRFFAAAIILVVMFLTFFVSFDLMTYFRGKCKGK